MQMIRDHIDSSFHPRSILDFGCGVGRTLVSFAKIGNETTGVDVSKSMLQEASTNCREHGVSNVRFLRSDDALTEIRGTFDLIHSSIVFQHIPVARGKILFRTLLTRLTPSGIGAFQFLYSKVQYENTFGVAPLSTLARGAVPQVPTPDSDPEMQMNPYNMNEILFLIQRAGATKIFADFTDHGGELGLFLFFKLT
jgi:SAM-dependent methyltransferase